MSDGVPESTDARTKRLTRVRCTGTAQVVSTSISGSIAAMGVEWPMALACLLGVYTYSHYFFASTTAQVSQLSRPRQHAPQRE
jgi:hypothetical protein